MQTASRVCAPFVFAFNPQAAYTAGLECLYLPQLCGEIPVLHYTKGIRKWNGQSDTGGGSNKDLYRVEVSGVEHSRSHWKYLPSTAISLI